jgi:hypothetical protein
MRHRREDIDLACVRGLEALAKLPEVERKPWQELWDDAANTLARAQASTTPPKTTAANYPPAPLDCPGVVYLENLGRFLGSATHCLPSRSVLKS